MFGVPSIQQPLEVASRDFANEASNASELANRDSSNPVLAQIEKRSQRLLVALETIAEQLQRVADHFVPPENDKVGSTYLAQRLGCSTTWIGRMALDGKIPRRCIVPGTGNGRLWKFYRVQIDDWLATRRPNGCD